MFFLYPEQGHFKNIIFIVIEHAIESTLLDDIIQGAGEIMSRALALHAANLGVMPSIPYDSPSTSRSNF